MQAPLFEIHPSTWRFMRHVYGSWYSQQPELSLAAWLGDMRLAHSVLVHDNDIEVVRMVAQAIAILEYTIIARGGQLPLEITAVLPNRY